MAGGRGAGVVRGASAGHLAVQELWGEAFSFPHRLNPTLRPVLPTLPAQRDYDVRGNKASFHA